jgi:hypothetical protein
VPLQLSCFLPSHRYPWIELNPPITHVGRIDDGDPPSYILTGIELASERTGLY